MPDSASSLGKTIRERRVALRLTQEQLAELISDDDEYVRQSEISRIEAGRVLLPRRSRLERLAHVLGLSLVDLLLSSDWAEDTEPPVERENIAEPDPIEPLPLPDIPPHQLEVVWTDEFQRHRSPVNAEAKAVVYEQITSVFEDNRRRYELNKQRFEESRERFQTRIDSASIELLPLDTADEPAPAPTATRTSRSRKSR
jgi:transcriptional regulator with XRE-family HTH domain